MLCRVDEKRVGFRLDSEGLNSIAAILMQLEEKADLYGCNGEFVRGLIDGLSLMGIRVEKVGLNVTHLKKKPPILPARVNIDTDPARAVGKVRHYDHDLGCGVIDTECGKKVSVGWKAVFAMGKRVLVADDIVELRIVDGPELEAAELCLVFTQD